MRGQSLVNVYEMRDVELQADVTVIFGRFHHNVMVFFIDRLNAGAQQHWQWSMIISYLVTVVLIVIIMTMLMIILFARLALRVICWP